MQQQGESITWLGGKFEIITTNPGGTLDTKQMLLEVETEIVKLQRVADALRGTVSNQSSTPSRLSAVARQKISLAQKARWSKQRSDAEPTKPKRVISAASRRKMAAAQRARWAKVNRENKAA
jgi:hypothetical protein